jgi:hypothetical protein
VSPRGGGDEAARLWCRLRSTRPAPPPPPPPACPRARFRVYDIDFGVGRPVRMRLPRAHFDGLGIVLPAPPAASGGDGDGGVEVYVGLRSDHWARLAADEELARFVTLSPS